LRRRTQDIFMLLKKPAVSNVKKWECKSFSNKIDLDLGFPIPMDVFDAF
jgi:hypothetical protein